MENRVGKKVLSNLAWRFAERSGAQVVQFVVQIVLARLLGPELFGKIAIITVFIAIFQVFVDSGLGNALIQKKDSDDLDFSTVFYTNVVFCTLLYLLIFIISPIIARFYDDDTFISIIRILGLTILISGLKNVQQAYVSKKLMFKKFFFSTLIGTLVSAFLGIAVALLGGGIWALVVQQLSNLAIDTLVVWITVDWKPKRMFSFARLKTLFSYGWKLLASSLLDNIYTNIRQLIIGKMYTTSDLAFYNRGRQFPNLVVSNINSSIDSVLLPVLSDRQDNVNSVKEMTRNAIQVSTYIIAPLMLGLTATAEPLVRVLLTDTWSPCVPFLRLFCVSFLFYPIHTANLNAIKALGRSDLFLKLEIMKKIVGMVVLLSTMWFGVMAMAYSMLFTSVCAQIINCWPNKKLLNYGYFEQIKDILPSLVLSSVMGICVYCIQWLGMSDIITLGTQVIVGSIVYLVLSRLFRINVYMYLMRLVGSMFRNNQK